MNRTIAKIKKINSSLPFFIAILLLTLSVVVNFIGTTSLFPAIENLAINTLESNPSFADAEKNLFTVLSGLPIYLYAQLAFMLLIAAGMWIHFFANKKSGDIVSNTGLNIIKLCKALQITSIVASYLLIGFVVGMTSLIILEGIKSFLPEIDNAIIIYVILGIAAAIWLISLIATIFYYRGIFRTIKSIKMTLSTGVIMGKVSFFVIFFNYVIAIVLSVIAISSPTIITMIGEFLHAASFVFFSVALSSLRSEMRYIASRGGSNAE